MSGPEEDDDDSLRRLASVHTANGQTKAQASAGAKAPRRRKRPGKWRTHKSSLSGPRSEAPTSHSDNSPPDKATPPPQKSQPAPEADRPPMATATSLAMAEPKPEADRPPMVAATSVARPDADRPTMVAATSVARPDADRPPMAVAPSAPLEPVRDEPSSSPEFRAKGPSGQSVASPTDSGESDGSSCSPLSAANSLLLDAATSPTSSALDASVDVPMEDKAEDKVLSGTRKWSTQFGIIAPVVQRSASLGENLGEKKSAAVSGSGLMSWGSIFQGCVRCAQGCDRCIDLEASLRAEEDKLATSMYRCAELDARLQNAAAELSAQDIVVKNALEELAAAKSGLEATAGEMDRVNRAHEAELEELFTRMRDMGDKFTREFKQLTDEKARDNETINRLRAERNHLRGYDSSPQSPANAPRAQPQYEPQQMRHGNHPRIWRAVRSPAHHTDVQPQAQSPTVRATTPLVPHPKYLRPAALASGPAPDSPARAVAPHLPPAQSKALSPSASAFVPSSLLPRIPERTPLSPPGQGS